jgi:biopolymer transport protein ExbB
VRTLTRSTTKTNRLALAAAALLLAAPLPFQAAHAQTQVATLDALLQQTRDARSREQAANQERERRFIENRDRQAELLAEAQRRLANAQGLSQSLNSQFDSNETRLGELQDQLDERSGTLGEMFGVVRLAAGDAAAVMHNSMISAEHPLREDFLNELAQSRELPTIDALERLWYEMQREMTASGTVTRFDAPVVAADGIESEIEVVRVGPFTAMAGSEFLTYQPESHRFAELTRQPPGRYGRVAGDLAGSTAGYTRAVVDPTRGSLLAVLVQQPGLGETIEYGGLVGYVIIALASVGLLVAMGRLFRLSEIGRSVAKQKKNIERPHDNNPLGRVLMVYHHDPEVDKETLQLRLDEAVLKEIPRLESGLGAIKILAAIGPLMGLLGTVTGMIITFQQITLFGTGDPKLMAGGISQALVTTVMGLVMAIPLLLLHSYLSSRSGNLVHLLEEETAGIIAEQAEKGRATA